MNAKMSETRVPLFGVPSNPDHLRQVFTPQQLRDIANHIGAGELARLSQDPNHNPENEGQNLDTVRRAVSAVIGEDAGAPVILNSASFFANGLLGALEGLSETRVRLFGVPSNPDHLRQVFTTQQLRDIANHIGPDELARLSQDPNQNPENEGQNLDTVRRAVSAVIGEDAGAPVILNSASFFANGLLGALEG